MTTNSSVSSNTHRAIGLLGDAGVGKTALSNALRAVPFEPRYHETYGYHVHPITVNGTIINLWDTAGQDKYSPLKYNYVAQLDAAILMFDVMSLISFKNITTHWIPLVKERFGDIPIIVIGNKADCQHHNRTVMPGDYIEISSKTHHNIPSIINWITSI
jgi:small GTP-binding protein